MTISGLETAIDPSRILTDSASLAARSRDWWPLARIRERNGKFVLPAAVVLPQTAEEIAAVVRWARSSKTALIPRGGGSGVSGGALAEQNAVIVDMSGMAEVIDLDMESNVVHAQAGIVGADLEKNLARSGLTIGHYPQSMNLSTVGGWIAAAGAGQATPGYGLIEDRVVGMRVVLGTGAIVELEPRPRSAAGPDLRRLMIGSDGSLGIVTDAHLVCSPKRAGFSWHAFSAADFGDCLAFARTVRWDRIEPTILRGWDPVDAESGFASFDHGAVPVILVGFDLALPGLEDRIERVKSIAAGLGARNLSNTYGQFWWDHRLDAVQSFEDILGPTRALGDGAMLDTLEVAGLWSQLPRLYRDIRNALAPHTGKVGCHFSHVYSSGAALYYTFTLQAGDDEGLEDLYWQAWDAAIAACRNAGGTISHHHGMGRLKARYAEREFGHEGMTVLRDIKRALDPDGIMNPGALIPTPE